MSKNPEKLAGPIKAAGADYPVDPAERSNQEARLKKAAAAGVSASKSPIPSSMLQRSSVVTSQNVVESQATLSKSASLTATAPETPDEQNTPRLNSDEVLAELRKLSAWADLQRKTTRWAIVLLILLVPVAIGGFILMGRDLKTNLESNLSPHQPDWYDVDRKVRAGDFEKATAIGEELILKTPQYPEAHQKLAAAYLAAGNLDKAKEHYAEAFRLFPSEENEKLLNAIEKRVQGDK